MNTHLFIRENGRHTNQFHTSYTPSEMAEVFTPAERATLDAGEVLVRGSTQYVNAAILATRAFGPVA